MPVTLVVLPKNVDVGQTTSSEAENAVTFDGTRIVLGRGASADLSLPDASVSLRHATIRTSGADYVVFDEGSTNGTFHGETRLTPHVPRTLKSGDRIRLGRIWLEVRIGAAPVTRDLASTTRDLALAMVAEMLAAGGDDSNARVSVQGGPDDGITLRLVEDGRHYVVGRGDASDLLLSDPDCSREHVIFLRRGPQMFIVDLGSKNGAYLGSQRLPAHVETRVPSGRLVQVGRTVLVAEEPTEVALLGLTTGADEVLAEGEVALSPPVSIGKPPTSAEPSPTSRGVDLPPRSSAEIVEMPRSLPRPIEPPSSRAGTPRKARGLRVADVVVILVALSLIGLSVAGLYWLVGPGK